MAGDPDVSEGARKWATAAHLSIFAGFFVPLGNVFGPFVVLLLCREEGEFAEFNAREALNFQISMTVYTLLAGLLTFVSVYLLSPIGIVLLFLPAVLLLVNLAFVVKAAVETSERRRYEYPLSMRFI